METTDNNNQADIYGELVRKQIEIEDQILEIDVAKAETMKEFKDARGLLSKRLESVKQQMRMGALQPDMFSGE